MEKKIGKTLLKYFIASSLAAGMTVGILSSQGYFGQTDTVQKYKNLCDAFTVPGVLYMLFAGLLYASGGGVFDGIAFSVGKFVNIFAPAAKRNRETYLEYKQRKRGGGKLKGYSFIFFSGLTFFIVGMVFLILFYRVF